MSNVIQVEPAQSNDDAFAEPATTGVFSAGTTETVRREQELETDLEALAQMPYRDARAQAIAAFERTYVRALLERCGGNVSRAARLAGLDRVYLHRLMRKHAVRVAKRRYRLNKIEDKASANG